MPAQKAKSWNWRAIVRDLETSPKDIEWAIRNWTKETEAEFKKKDCDMLASRLSTVGDFVRSRGLLRIAKHDLGGWSDLHTGWRYQAWDFQTMVSVHEKTYRRDSNVQRALPLLIQAIAFGERGFARWCGQRTLKDSRGVAAQWFRNHTIFVLQMYCLWRGKRNDCLNWDAGPYNAVIDAWKTPRLMKRAISRICDFHCANSAPLGRGEFWQHEYGLVPFEVAALYRIRDWVHLPTPDVRHPLLETPFARIPQPMPRLQFDPLLERVIRRYRKLKPRVKGLKTTYFAGLKAIA
jgi:hypothetical protein